MLLIVNKAIPASNLNEFIAWLKANPDKAIFGTAGGTPAMQDIVGGHIDGIFISGRNGQKTHTGSARNPDNGRGGIARILFLDMGGAVCP